ncbi:MAG TPA: pyridoxal phosphate-dependent aminotransferase [Desulfomicrobiaceae bacterium]|nr:pyridoxal phosphate-dependent aminotransferase [Desulfomicrobiaceae bacterium]
MTVIASQIQGYMERASWIRRMFEAGTEMKQKYGAENVFDFSLGNPDLAPPPAVGEALRDLADRADQPFVFGYMPNAGYPALRERLAEYLSAEQGVALKAEHITVTCGAAGGINAFFKAVLEPGDEVLCPAPFFVEYGFYVQNHGGVFKTVPAREMTFELDLEAFEAAITDRTRVVLVNSPNNPTGQVYSREEMDALAEILRRHSQKNGRPIFLVSDEPYRFLAYDNVEVPSLLALYEYAVVISSFSKNLALAGERVGYVALNPDMPDVGQLAGALVLTNRILGFVNAPAVGQHIVARALGQGVDLSVYEARREAMARVLTEAGYRFSMPRGGFYFFPAIPEGKDDTTFVNTNLMNEKILAVPGTGFGYPGYFRLAFCVDQSVIEGAADGFTRAFQS